MPNSGGTPGPDGGKTISGPARSSGVRPPLGLGRLRSRQRDWDKPRGSGRFKLGHPRCRFQPQHEDFRQHGRAPWLLWRFVGGVALAVHTSENFLSAAKHLLDCSRRIGFAPAGEVALCGECLGYLPQRLALAVELAHQRDHLRHLHGVGEASAATAASRRLALARCPELRDQARRVTEYLPRSERHSRSRRAPLTYRSCAEPPATTKSSSAPDRSPRPHLFFRARARGCMRQDGPTALNEVLFRQHPAENCTAECSKCLAVVACRLPTV